MKLINIIFITLIVFLYIGCTQKNILPQPSGKFAVGTRYLVFTDKERPELFTTDTTDFREITTKVWYPAENNSKVQYMPYIKNGDESVRILNLPPFYRNLKTHSKLNLPLSNGERHYPILIFNHGWGEHYSQNTILMEELASHGYIVMSIAHHYEARFSFYPDGQFITFNPNNTSDRFRQIMQEQRNPEAMQIFKRMFTANSTDKQESIFKETNELLPTFLVEGSRLWAEDIISAINQLEFLNKENDFFKGKLDLDKIGVFGMSMGGIATCQACLQDKRIKAGINMDGGIYGDVFDSSLSKPFMFINSIRYNGYENVFLKRLKNSGVVITIKNADHYNFHDISILDPTHQMLGSIDGNRMLKLLNEYTLAFFNEFLKGIESEMFDPEYPKYEEIKISIINL
jgi:predicted dienelactone hydrolase